MKFYRLSDIPVQADEQVFKASSIGAGMALFVIAVITVATLLLGISHVDGVNIPSFVFYIVSTVAALFGLIAFRSFRASLKPSNWLLRCHRNGVFIHFRSFLNWRFLADTVQAVGFDYTEITWAGIVEEDRTSPGMGDRTSRQVQHLTFLKLGLVDTNTAALEQQLRQEEALKPDGVMIDLDYPVQVLPGGIIELRWSGTRPSVEKAVKFLGRHVKIIETDSRKVDLTHKRNSKLGEEDGKILELARRGDELGAIKLTRMTYDYSLSEARDFVAKLRSGTK